MSCGRLALERSGFKIDKYYASEISTPKIEASKNYFPDNIYIGDVTKISGYNYKDVAILIGGSPCQGFSIMGDRLNFKDPRSGLIMQYFRILNEIKQYNPDVKFLLENVSMDKRCEIEISRRLGVLPVKINSSRVSGQTRPRVYWTNIKGTGDYLFGSEIEQPTDRWIILPDILQPECDIDKKYYLSGNKKAFVHGSIKKHGDKYCKLNGRKARAILEGYANKWNGTFIQKENSRIRQLTIIECCRLQTVPDDFFNGSEISDNQQYSCLGDGWTVDVICHILRGLINH